MRLYQKNKKVFGMGTNDADYNVISTMTVNNILYRRCPYYSRWCNMLKRCYNESSLRANPTYTDCYVCDEWLVFSNFKAWMEKQDWEGKALDKDILTTGSKVYSPETCVFVNPILNNFLCDAASIRGEFPLGVYKCSRKGQFIARCCNPFTKKYDWLGRHNTPEEAHLAWKSRKHELACELADSDLVTDERLAEALRNRYK